MNAHNKELTHNIILETTPSQLQVETVDRGGSFLGTITTKGPRAVNLGLALLSHGLAKLHPSFEPSRVAGGKELASAEAKARDKRLKVLAPSVLTKSLF